MFSKSEILTHQDKGGGQPVKKSSVSRKKSGQTVERKDKLKNDNSKSERSKNDNSYKYCDPNVSFLVHDVVKRGGCETFVIDFEGDDAVAKKTKKKPPRLARPKSSSSQSNASSQSSSSPSANVKSMNVTNSRKTLSGPKQLKEISNKAIKSNVNGNNVVTTNGSPINNNKRKLNNKRSQTNGRKDEKGINTIIDTYLSRIDYC